jgi:hypothetical protein
MGHYCRICGCDRPNQSFSGRGHRNHVCKKCSQLPGEVRFRIEALAEIWGFLAQSVISDKNIHRLSVLSESSDPEVREMASIVHAIGKAHAGRRRRYKKIRADHPKLWQMILQKGIVEDWGDPAGQDYNFETSKNTVCVDPFDREPDDDIPF